MTDTFSEVLHVNGEPAWNEAFSNNILTKFSAGQHFIIYWIETCHSHENNLSQCKNIPLFLFLKERIK